MRILAVSNLYPNPLQPNRATYNRQQFRAMADGCAVGVIAPISWTEEVRAGRKTERRISADRREVLDEIVVDHPRYFFPPKFLRSWYGYCFEKSIASRFRQRVAEFKPDVVLGSWAYPDGWAVVRLARDAGLPVVVKVHGSDVLTLTRSALRRTKTAKALCEADGVIAVSRHLVAKVISFGVRPEKVRLIYNGVDTTLFHPGPAWAARQRLGLPEDGFVILSAGNLVPVKGLDVLLRACAALRERKVRFACYIIGEGPLRASLQRQVESLGLGEYVKLVGGKPHAQMPEWFRAADVFVLPSHSEGVPNVLLEAGASDCRWVATRVGGIPEIAELAAGELVSDGDHLAFADVINRILNTPRPAIADRPERFRSHAVAAAEVVEFLGDISRVSRSVRAGVSRSGEDPVLEHPHQAMPASAPIAALSASKLEPLGAGAPAFSGRQILRRILSAVVPRNRFIVHAPAASRRVCLTFDDGPHPEHTPRLLDVLHEYQSRATFFLIGREAERHPQIVKRIIEEGHVVGNHTYNHLEPHEVSSSQLIEEVRRTEEIIENITGRPAHLFRPPRGKLTTAKLLKLWWAKQSVVLWSVDPKDWASPSTASVLEWFRRRPLRGGDIVLMHDNLPHAAAMLPEVLRQAVANGLTFATVPEVQ